MWLASGAKFALLQTSLQRDKALSTMVSESLKYLGGDGGTFKPTLPFLTNSVDTTHSNLDTLMLILLCPRAGLYSLNFTTLHLFLVASSHSVINLVGEKCRQCTSRGPL